MNATTLRGRGAMAQGRENKKKGGRTVRACLATAVALATAGGVANAGPLAFPGAEGYGKQAAGGRGGAVIAVTRLDDAVDGTGSPESGTLRACVNAAGPRTCVFRVGGVFVLTQGSLLINRPFLTIAGQTAPGGGVLITHDGGSAARTPVLVKNTTDVVVRHVRSRPLKSPAPASNSGFTVEGAQRVILDHVSTSWAEDQNISVFAGTTDLTVSWSIAAEGLMPHSKCALVSSWPTGPQRITFARNICASNNDRNPDLHSQPNSCLDVINNVFYNVKSAFAEIWGNFGGTWANIAGNVFRRGPNTISSIYGMMWQDVGATGTPRIYQTANLADGSRITMVDPDLEPYLVATPVCALSAGRDSATKAYTQALARAGAFPRDAVDARIVGEVTNRTGSLKTDPGPMPAIDDGVAYADVDQDGMSDAWESQNGRNPALFDAWSGKDESGFFALDRFLDYAHQQRLSGSAVP